MTDTYVYVYVYHTFLVNSRCVFDNKLGIKQKQ